MVEVGKLTFEDGALKACSPNVPTLAWDRPAALAEARLACDPPPAALEVADGRDALAAAFKVLPFVREPLPAPTFGDAVTPAARAAFLLLAEKNLSEKCDAFRVLRGEVDDFIVFARRWKDVWHVGALAVAETTLTVRFEDLWSQLPKNARFAEYLVEVEDDAGRRVLEGVAPDARIALDVKANGGFALTFWPVASRLA